MTAAAPCLLLFARAPEAGHVKTRLEPALGSAGAAALYGAFLEDAGRRYLAPSLWSGVLCAEPDASSPQLARYFPPPWRLEAQAPGGLGDRLEAAFRAAFDRGAPAAVALGSDHPALSRRRVAEVFERIREDAPAVVIPAEDGGYCAIGLRAGSPVEEIFRDISWSSGRVLRQTVERLSAAGLEPVLLQSSYDVDRPEDLERLAVELGSRDRADEDSPRATAEVLAALLREGRS